MSLIQISKSREALSKLTTFWIPFKTYRRTIRGILQFGTKNYLSVLKNDKNTKFKHDLAICSIMKNEGPYLQEWLEYYILVGVKKFYLYDNESTDDTKEILKPYIKAGIVEYTYFPGKTKQIPAYLDCIQKHKNEIRWLALIDLDEFIVTKYHKKISDFLYTLPQFSQLIIPWVQYGSSGHKEKPNGLVMENYKHHADKSWGVKAIINPRLAINITNPHANDIAGFTINEKGKRLGRVNQSGFGVLPYDKIRCNHYVTKSYEEYVKRSERGSAAQKNSPRPLEKFNWYDRNEIYDDIMDKYIKKLKNKISG